MFVENEFVEFKRQVTGDIAKEIIAFANASGGTIYIGIDDDGAIVGVGNADDVLLQAKNIARDAILPNLMMFVKFKKEMMDGKNVIAIEVAEGSNKPYYLKSKGMRPVGVFKRNGSGIDPVSEEGIRMLIKATDGDSYESMRSLEQNLTFEMTGTEFQERNLEFSEAKMRTLGIINNEDQFTNLALLLSDQCRHSIKVALFQDTTQTNFLDRNEFGGSVFRQLEMAYEFIAKHNQLHSSFSGLRRIDKRDYPEAALREALLNCVVHRDYSKGSSTLVGVYADRMEFTNVGALPRGLNLQDIMAGYSECRNPLLGNVFYRLELIETYGTGITKIINAYSDCDKKPKFLITENIFKLVLPNRNYVDTFQNGLVREPEENSYGKKDEYITREELQKRLGVSQATAVRIINKKIAAGELRAIGNGKSRKYLILDC